MKKILFLIIFVTTINNVSAQRYRGFGSDDYSKFRIGLQGGWSYRLAKVSDKVPAQFKSYIEGLKPGFNFGANATFFFNRSVGLGIWYSGFRTSNELKEFSGVDTITKRDITGTMSDKIMMHYLGPTLCTRFISDNGWLQLVSNISLGYLSFTDNAEVVTKYTYINTDVMVNKSKITGSTLGMVFGIGADFRVLENVYMGVEATGMLGTLSQYDMESNGKSQHFDLKDDEREGLSRIDISGGLHFNF